MPNADRRKLQDIIIIQMFQEPYPSGIRFSVSVSPHYHLQQDPTQHFPT